MADDNNEEKLRITAELDTSKLKQEARTGLQSVSNEAQKVENQFKRTSTSIDGVGKSVTKASQQSAQALKQMGKEADNASRKIANIEKSVKQINLGRSLGIASQLAGSDFGKSVGASIGNAIGMSGNQQTVAGGILQGGLAGAAMGGGTLASIPLALVGAAGGLASASDKLIDAASKQMDSAEALRVSAREREKQIRGEVGAIQEHFAYKDIEQYTRNMENMSADELRTKLPELMKLRNEWATNVDTQGNYLRGLADKIGANPDIYDASSGLLGDEFGKLQQFEKALGAIDGFITKLNARLSQLDKSESDASIRDKLNGLTAQENGISSLLGNLKGDYKLSDALTRVGGGGGYGAQMSGVANNVTTIKNTLNSILTEIKLQKTQVTSGIFTEKGI